MKTATWRTLLGSLMFAACATSSFTGAPGATITRTETFPSAAGDEFVAVGATTSDGSNIQWVSSNNAGGAASGELGETFARSSTMRFYADTDLGGSLSIHETFVLAGTFKLTNINGNGSALIGYFNTASLNNGPLVGIQITEPANATSKFRTALVINGSTALSGSTMLDIGTAGAPPDVAFTAAIPFNLTYSYNPGTGVGTLSGTIDGVNKSGSLGGLGSSTSTFNAFGVGTGYAGSNLTNAFKLYADDLTYSLVSVPEPNSLTIMFVTLGLLVSHRRKQPKLTC